MKKRIVLTFLAGTAILSLSACAKDPTQKDFFKDAHYWQRSSTTEATYLRGPKVQQMLNQDISRCVVELRELERLGALRMATPADEQEDGEIPDPNSPEGQLAGWETPERDGDLRAEHLEYDDFETCMMHKGWERMEYVPYDVANTSRENYAKTILGESYRTRIREKEAELAEQKGDFEDLNE